MVYKSLVALVTMVLTLPVAYAQNSRDNSELAIQKLEQLLEVAIEKGDSAQLDRLIANDYIEITAQGDVRKKADLLAAARAMNAGTPGVTEGPEKTVDDLTIRVHGDSAVVTGRMTTRNTFISYQTTGPRAGSQKPAIVDQERFLRVYVKVEGRWRLIAWQTTSIARR